MISRNKLCIMITDPFLVTCRLFLELNDHCYTSVNFFQHAVRASAVLFLMSRKDQIICFNFSTQLKKGKLILRNTHDHLLRFHHAIQRRPWRRLSACLMNGFCHLQMGLLRRLSKCSFKLNTIFNFHVILSLVEANLVFQEKLIMILEWILDKNLDLTCKQVP